MTNIPTSYLEPARIQTAKSHPHGTCVDCKSVLNIGIFFDGTGNNLYIDKPDLRHSNVARLFDAYKEVPGNGYFRHYIQGVGTPFKEIGESGNSTSGSAFAAGGEARIIWGMLQVLNSIHQFLTGGIDMFKPEQMTALASGRNVSGQYPLSPEDRILDALDLRAGLVGNSYARRQFLARSAGKLKAQLEHRDTAPNISGVYLDVFGFSRGAALSRAFCNWLHDDLFHNGKLCGVPAYMRTLGLFDTVASVNLSRIGHDAWATTPNLRIHPAIITCVHYAALHEFRNNFPLDSVCENGVLPPNCYEQIGPGSHSDMGGSYEPGSQGMGIRLETPDPYFPDHTIPIKDDSYKLSQLPLNLMLEVARRVRENHGDDGDPWLDFRSDMAISRDLANQFACHPSVRTAATNYFATCGITPGPIDEMARRHSTLYLAWRRAVNFKELPSVRYAESVDVQKGRDDRLRGEEFFQAQLAAVKSKAKTWTEEEFAKIAYHGKAGQIYQLIETMPVPYGVGLFFDGYVHDSFAGFIGFFYGDTAGDFGRTLGHAGHVIGESKRYLTYRIVYQGDDRQYNT